VNQRHALSQQSDFGGLAEQGTGEGEKAHRLTTQSRRKRLHESEATMLSGYRNAH
jgi:hypothetical protein